MSTTEDEKKSDIKVMKERKKTQSKRLRQQLKQKNNLSIIKEELLEKLQKLELEFQGSVDSYTDHCSHATADTEKAGQKLTILRQNVHKALEIHGDLSGVDVFPSKLSTDEYFKAEEEFTASLTGFTKRQFFEGIADMAGSRDKLRYEILEVNKPESLLIRGESEDVLQAKCEELQRLQSVYASSQAERLKSHCDLHRINACLHRTEDIISKMQVDQVTLDSGVLNSQLADLRSECEEKSHQLHRIFTDQMAPLIEEMSEMQTAKVLSGNFDLKISRQDYFISKQDEVIQLLLLQNSRYEFLSILYEMEAKSHRDTHYLLSSARSILSNEETALKKRIDSLVKHSQDKDPRETIDSRDHFMQNLFKVLESGDASGNKRSFVTYDMMHANFKAFLQKPRSILDEKDLTDDSILKLLDEIMEELEMCSTDVLGKNVRDSDEPQEDFSEGIAKIEDVITTIEKSVKSAISEVDKKKKALASDSMKALQRTLFINFFNDPARMRRIVNELRTRVEALSR